MNESTCPKMVIDLLKIFCCLKCLFLHFFISSKYEFYVDAGIMIAKTRETSKIICVDSYLMARKIFRWDIYRSHPTIKVALYYYFFTRDAWYFGGAGYDIFTFCLEYSRDSRSPAPYKQLCQILKFY